MGLRKRQEATATSRENASARSHNRKWYAHKVIEWSSQSPLQILRLFAEDAHLETQRSYY
jgi:hypothetical protein